MPRNGIVTALVLVLLTGIVIGQTRSLVTSQRQTVPAPETGSATAADEFYAAVNHYLKTGESALLDAMLSPDFVRYGIGMSGEVRAPALLEYLALFRQTFPGARWETRVLSHYGPLVAFEVRIQSAPASEIAETLTPDSGGDAGYEILRVEDGQVAEWWADVTAPPPLEHAYPSNGNSSALARLEPRVEVVAFDSHAIYEIVDQNAMIVVAMEGDVRVQTADTIVLPPGAATYIPPGADVRFTNGGRESAALLLISLQDRQLVVGPATDYNVIESVGVRRWLQAGGGELPSAIDQATVQIERILLFPGESVPAHTAGPAELLAIDSGAIEVSVLDGRAVWTQPGKSFLAVEGSQVITQGTGLWVNPGSRVGYRASGDVPPVFWLITLVPI